MSTTSSSSGTRPAPHAAGDERQKWQPEEAPAIFQRCHRSSSALLLVSLTRRHGLGASSRGGSAAARRSAPSRSRSRSPRSPSPPSPRRRPRCSRRRRRRVRLGAARALRPSGRSGSRSRSTRALGDPVLAEAKVGVAVVDVDTGKPLYTRNEPALFNPASNVKLFTTGGGAGAARPRVSLEDGASTPTADLRRRAQGQPVPEGARRPVAGGRGSVAHRLRSVARAGCAR